MAYGALGGSVDGTVKDANVLWWGVERTKVLKAMEMTLQKTAMKIVTIVNQYKDHIPPITTSEANPFPYQIVLNPRSENWGTRIGIF